MARKNTRTFHDYVCDYEDCNVTAEMVADRGDPKDWWIMNGRVTYIGKDGRVGYDLVAHDELHFCSFQHFASHIYERSGQGEIVEIVTNEPV